MGLTEIELLELILINLQTIKGFCYGIALFLMCATVLFIVQKFLNYTIGQSSNW